MARPTQNDLARALLDRHGRTFAQELRIDVSKGSPSPLFRLLCASLLMRRLPQEAGRERDPRRERSPLKKIKGLGDVGVDIFFGEAQMAWGELEPFADRRA